MAMNSLPDGTPRRERTLQKDFSPAQNMSEAIVTTGTGTQHRRSPDNPAESLPRIRSPHENDILDKAKFFPYNKRFIQLTLYEKQGNILYPDTFHERIVTREKEHEELTGQTDKYHLHNEEQSSRGKLPKGSQDSIFQDNPRITQTRQATDNRITAGPAALLSTPLVVDHGAMGNPDIQQGLPAYDSKPSRQEQPLWVKRKSSFKKLNTEVVALRQERDELQRHVVELQHEQDQLQSEATRQEEATSRLVEKQGREIEWRRVTGNLYKGMPYKTPFDLVRERLTGYGESALSKLISSGAIPEAQRIGTGVVFPPTAVEQIIEREEKSKAGKLRTTKGGGRTPGHKTRQHEIDQSRRSRSA